MLRCVQDYIFKVADYIERQRQPKVKNGRFLSLVLIKIVMLCYGTIVQDIQVSYISKNSSRHYSLKVKMVFSVEFVNYPSMFTNLIQFNHTNHLIFFP